MSVLLKQDGHFVYQVIFIHTYTVELACHDKQNGSQRFSLRTRISELWQFKAHKVENTDIEDGLLFFKPGLWQTSE